MDHHTKQHTPIITACTNQLIFFDQF